MPRQVRDRHAHRTRRFSRSLRRTGFERLEERIVLSGSPTVLDVEVGSTAWSTSFREFLESSYSMEGSISPGYRIPTGTSNQSTPLVWTNLDTISLRFSKDVNVRSHDLSISGVNSTSLQIQDFIYDAQTYVAKWTLSAPLGADVYQLDLSGGGFAPVTDLEGNALDGEWVDNQSTISGDGAAGGDFEFRFAVLPGDVYDRDGDVDYLDYLYALTHQGATTTIGSYSIYIDVDGSGENDYGDVAAVQSNLWTSIPTGVPEGDGNDAPRSTGIPSLQIDNTAVDEAVSLFDAFDDAEDGDSSLAFQVEDVSDATLFDDVSFNPATGELVFDASNGAYGRSSITVRATDTGGLSTDISFFVDVNYQNVAPWIYFVAEQQTATKWKFSGFVYDPDNDVRGTIVQFEGVVEERATIWDNGTFEIVVIIAESESGHEYASTTDSLDALSNVEQRYVGFS